ncbi:MAG TPA: hypothetical protein VJB59_12120 [Bdellovibrionota bacterium]|nr:hypothetical protein [Bdellovibrionota bacterium]
MRKVIGSFCFSLRLGLCFGLYILMMFGLAACNETGTGENSLTRNDSSVTTPAPPTPLPTPTPTPSPTTPVSTGKVYIGPDEVEKFVNKFVDDGKMQGLDVLPDMKGPTLQIQISSLNTYGSSVIGLCESGGTMRRVTFDPDFWNSVSDTQRELLAHHELGHCVLYRPHRNDVLSTGAYASIMYPIIMGSSTYLNNYSYYLQELFTWTASAVMAKVTEEPTVHICNLEDL